ncbi:hypothetical protein [Streptomyces sp. NPDC059906]|uniref:hypothetical protein n=1 Tax=Streptomyces sp. NPDC059906 TaxID=3346997 RepID=UPI003661FB43
MTPTPAASAPAAAASAPPAPIPPTGPTRPRRLLRAVAVVARLPYLALVLTRPWGRRMPARSLAFPVWVATGLLAPIMAGYPLQLLARAVTGGAATAAVARGCRGPRPPSPPSPPCSRCSRSWSGLTRRAS